jgi:outer membrane protein OmpA-like peptidoglycan-associated protein
VKLVYNPMKLSLSIILLVLISTFSYGQTKKIAFAEKYYNAHRYAEASEIYLELINKDKIDASTNADVFRNAAEACIKCKKYTEANDVLSYLSGTDQFTFDDGYKLIKLLLYMDRAFDAQAIYQHQAIASSIDPRKASLDIYFDTSRNFLDSMKRDTSLYSVSLATFNSNKGDFSPAFHPNGIAFTSARNNAMETPWAVENSAFLEQYIYDKFTTKVKKIKGIKGHKHDGVAYYDSTDAVWYYSKNLKSNKNVPLTTVGIYMYDATTKKETAFAYNNESVFVGHPVLSKDRQVLWFASNREGGFGGMDIWHCVRTSDGWGDPINAGSLINTTGDEMFPYEANGKLFFASNGHPGLGGLDIFKAELVGQDAQKVVNGGCNLNSHADDFSLIVDASDTNGYFSSNRGGDFIDRIYSVILRKPINDTIYVKFVQDSVADMLVQVFDTAGVLLFEGKTDEAGVVLFKGLPDMPYKIKTSHPDYVDLERPFTAVGLNPGDTIVSNLDCQKRQVTWAGIVTEKETQDKLEGADLAIKNLETGVVISQISGKDGVINVDLPPGEYQVTASMFGHDPKTFKIVALKGQKEVKQDVELSKTGKNVAVKLDNILYEYNKYTLSSIGKAELDTLVMFLKENKTVTVDVSSHTDSRGKNEYNMNLSKLRSQSCVNYLVTKGIPRAKLNVKNYGETELLNKCADGVECSEELHQINRRTEFVLIFPEEEKTNIK